MQVEGCRKAMDAAWFLAMPGTLEGDNDSTKVDLMRKLAAQAVALPAPLTETIVREVLHELEDGSRHALQTTLDCYKQKRMSAEDLISFVKTNQLQ